MTGTWTRAKLFWEDAPGSNGRTVHMRTVQLPVRTCTALKNERLDKEHGTNTGPLWATMFSVGITYVEVKLQTDGRYS